MLSDSFTCLRCGKDACREAFLWHCRHAGYRYCGHVMAHAYKTIAASNMCASYPTAFWSKLHL